MGAGRHALLFVRPRGDGGRVEAAAADGGGTEMTLRLPAYAAASTA